MGKSSRDTIFPLSAFPSLSAGGPMLKVTFLRNLRMEHLSYSACFQLAFPVYSKTLRVWPQPTFDPFEVDFGLTRKRQARLEKPTLDKYCSLLYKFVSDEEKYFLTFPPGKPEKVWLP